MNKQPRMIDADKLLKWIMNNDKAEGFWEAEKSNESFSYLCDTINSGEFDPIPLPTIKKYKCSECEGVSSAYAWNQETTLHFGGESTSIDNPFNDNDTFVCPACGEEQPRHMVELIPNE